MWIAKDKDGEVHLFYNKPYRDTVYGGNFWTIDVPEEIKEYTKGWDHYDAIIGYWMKVDAEEYPNLKWEDEPIDIALINRKRFWDIIMEEREAAAKLARNLWQGWAEGRVAKLQKRISALDRKIGKLLNSHKNTNEVKELETTITLTKYYEDYEKEHEWFVNMLKHQERYKDCTDEQIEEIWKDHIKEEYTFDEIWDTIQCDGYTKIVLRMGRHDNQPDYDYVLETKEYIDKKMKNYL